MTVYHTFARALAALTRQRPRFHAFGAALVASLLALTILAGCNSLSSGTDECQSFTIPNAAMSPTYNAGQLVAIDTQAYASASPKRGQVVIVREPSTNGQEEALRIIGLPGETVRLSATQTFINGKLLSEPFVLHRGTQQPMTVTLASNQYFLMGDNRPQSTDSRSFGPVSLNDIVAEIGTNACPND
ncbi:MAG TPA: signal peptidase I [Ktedonobacterales bacterium]|nr:signal peptidase I [Ktedonobacterales bacterium]